MDKVLGYMWADDYLRVCLQYFFLHLVNPMALKVLEGNKISNWIL